jgi:hypothetical protein
LHSISTFTGSTSIQHFTSTNLSTGKQIRKKDKYRTGGNNGPQKMDILHDKIKLESYPCHENWLDKALETWTGAWN